MDTNQLAYLKPTTGGWFRLWRNWWGVAWKPVDAPLLFSQRMGHTRTWTLGQTRFWILRPWRRQ